jgi:hypothetical protein
MGELVASVELDGGAQALVILSDGAFDGVLAARPRRLTLTSFAPAAGMARSDRTTTAARREPAMQRSRIDIGVLFRRGVEVPPDGRISLELLWLAPCDGEPALDEMPAREGTRFGSFEHTLCASHVGKTADGMEELEIAGIRAGFTSETKLRVGGKMLVFGEIIALAGDFYAHLDEDARAECEWAWAPPPTGVSGWLAGDYRATTLAGDRANAVDTIRKHIFAEDGGFFDKVSCLIDHAVGQYPTRRYLALASQNACHFACQPTGYADDHNEALALYRAYHRRALNEAAAARPDGDRDRLHAALVVDAFGCHFLTDLFASGHIRVPRRILGDRFGIVRGALMMAKKMHDEDNHIGLWCTVRSQRRPGHRVVWRAYGDGALAKPEATVHLGCVKEAVRVSVAEVFAAFAAARPSDVGRAEDLVPVPLAAGEMPTGDDVFPSGDLAPPVRPNHFPLYMILRDGRVAERVGAPDRNEYRPLEIEAPLQVAPVLGRNIL